METKKIISDEEFQQLCRTAKEKVEIPQMFENKLDTLIDNFAKKEKTRFFSLPKIAVWAGSIAASLAIILSIGFYLKNSETEHQYADNEQINIENLSAADREKVVEAHRVIMLVSQNYNKGLNSLSKAENQIQQLQSIVNKSFNKK